MLQKQINFEKAFDKAEESLNTLKEANDVFMEMNTNEGLAHRKKVLEEEAKNESEDESESSSSSSDESESEDEQETRDKPNPMLFTERRSKAQAPAEVLEGDWMKYFDDEAKCYYYWNETTQVSTYDRPEGFETRADAFSSVRNCSVVPDEHDKPKEWLSGGWKKYFCQNNQFDYYYHEDSGESSWNRPPGFETENDPFASFRAPAAGSVSKHDKPKEKMENGWCKYHDQSSNFYYYYNHESEQSTFERPLGFETESDPFASVRSKLPTAEEKIIEEVGGRWKKYLEEATDYFYYYNEGTGESTYDRPEEFRSELDPFADIRERNLASSNNFGGVGSGNLEVR